MFNKRKSTFERSYKLLCKMLNLTDAEVLDMQNDYGITVKELIAALKTFDPELEVRIFDPDTEEYKAFSKANMFVSEEEDTLNIYG